MAFSEAEREALVAEYDAYRASFGRYAQAARAGRAGTMQKPMTFEEWTLKRAADPTPPGGAPAAGAALPAGAVGAPQSGAEQEAAARAAGMPATAGGADGPLGLDGAPVGYTPWLPTTDGTVAQGKQSFYQAGSEFTEWQDKGEQDRVEWKQALWYAGFYGSKKPVLNGDLGPEDIDAMKQAMGLANLNGKSWQDAIAPRVELGQQQGGAYTGEAGSSQASGAFDQAVTQLRAFAKDNGIDLTEDFIGKQAQAVAGGQVSWDELTGNLRDKHVARAYPGFADDIRAGMSVKDAAAPYVATMARLLELPEADVDLKDPTIARALQAVDKDGKPATVPLWQFEQEIKKDSRWASTKNAWDEVGGQAYKVMQMFGLAG